MKLGLTVSNFGSKVGVTMDLIRLAESLGFDACFTAEAYGADAATPLAWIGAQTSKIKLGSAIMQIHGRTPAATAMTAMSVDELSGGRFLLGLGPSGPQVVEGWHGVSHDKPLSHLREYIEIIRRILKRDKPLEFQGEFYQIPYRGKNATGLGVPLKSILHPRADMKIYTAGITPNGVRLAAEIADGFFPVWTNPERFDVYSSIIEEGFRKAGSGKSYAQFDVIQNVRVVLGDDVAKCRDEVRPDIAFVVGGMGARGKNFYNDHIRRQGYEEDAEKIQTLFLDGKRKEATAAVSDKLIDAITLVGPRSRIADRVQAWRGTPVTTMNLSATQPEALRLMAELLL